jgi:hypothetical protein
MVGRVRLAAPWFAGVAPPQSYNLACYPLICEDGSAGIRTVAPPQLK